jgi:hypothetical protein
VVGIAVVRADIENGKPGPTEDLPVDGAQQNPPPATPPEQKGRSPE